MTVDEKAAMVIGLLMGAAVGFLICLFVASIPAVLEKEKRIEMLKFQLAQPDPHAVEVIRTDDGKLIALPKEAADAN